MAKIPEYKSSVQIQGADTVSFAGSTAGLSNTYDAFAQMGAQFAQNMADTRAMEAGIEAAKRGPQTLLPSPTSADAQYAKAFKEQQYSQSLANSTKFLERLTFNTQKYLNANSLMAMDGIAQQGIHELTQSLDPEVSRNLKPKLEAIYDSTRLKLEGQLFEQERQASKSNANFAIEKSMEAASDLIAQGNHRGAIDLYQSIESVIDDPIAYPDATHADRARIKEAFKETLKDADTRADISARLRNGMDVPGTLKKYANATTTKDNLRRAQVAYDTYRNYNTMVDSYDNKLIVDAQTKREMGTLTPFDMQNLKNELQPLTFAKFEMETLRWLKSHQAEEDTYAFFVANAQNPINLSEQTPQQLDKNFARRVQEFSVANNVPPDLNAQIEVAKGIDYAIPSLNKKISAGLNSGNPAIATDMAGLYASLKKWNPNTVSGVSDDAANKADIINAQLSAQVPIAEAYKNATNTVDGLTEAEIKYRQDQFKYLLSSHGYSDPVMQELLVGAQMGIGADLIPTGLMPDFMTAFKDAYIGTKNWDLALNKATERIKRVYGPEDINGIKMWSKFPTSITWPDNNLTLKRNMAIKTALGIFEGQKAAFLNPESTANVYYDFKEGTIRDVDNEYTQSRLTPKPGVFGYFKDQTFEVVRHEIDPLDPDKIHHIPGILIIKSDDYTQSPQPGQYPTQGYWFLPDGKNIPQMIYDAKTFTNARFGYNPEEIEKAKAASLQKFVDNKRNNDAASKELRDKIIEMREQLGEDLYFD